MTEKEFTDLKELINANTSLIKEFKLFAIAHLTTSFALNKTVDNQVKPTIKQSINKKAKVSTTVIIESARTITQNKN